MGKQKESLPNTPTYQEDSTFRKSFDSLAQNSQDMAGLNLSNNPNLMETIQFHPEMLDTFMNTLKTSMTPQLNDAKTDMTNELANLGALESSTTSNSLGRLNEGFLNTLQVQSGQFGLEAMMKAMDNRVAIAGMGMQGLAGASQVGAGVEKNRNDFNLANYENQVAKQLYDEGNKSGGWLGALQGGLGGAMSGFAVGGPVGALVGGVGGGLAGGFMPQSSGTGSTLMNMGVGSAGQMGLNKLSAPTAGATADNNLFRDSSAVADLRKSFMGGI